VHAERQFWRNVLSPIGTWRVGTQGPHYDPVMLSGSAVTLESGLRLSYVDQGTRSDPVVLFLPGPTDSWRSYQPVLDWLPPEVRVIALSQRGHGDSDKPETGYSVEHFAADIVPFLDVFGIERALLAGHSGACLVARRVALDHPERVAGLILEASPTTLRGHAGLSGFVESVVSGLDDPISPDFARSVVNDTSSDRVAPELLDQLVEDLLKVPARVWRAMFTDLLHYDDTAELDRISVPTLLLWGDGDALVPREMQDQLVSRIPDANLLVYPGVGHTPRWDDPSRFSNDVEAFAQHLRDM
jgi:non-heme chloroperoxidase